ncbi:DEKNAAC101666 [Brettanomyces naardenensis]|uniref:Mediator of RNA polymerase II transcription subunit 16 n=1 Tax=Brettanomyces naardenensis TaxID=13370 RepID=A0A448YIY6_BRENA|nr:DEKNAAC101666 [Brettanomyces naardenensis]
MTAEESEDHAINDTLVRRSQGGNQKRLISWSRQGHVAYSGKATNGSANLFITYLECVDGWTWQLAPSTPFRVENFVSEERDRLKTGPVVLPNLEVVSFSNTGWDLFTADTNGNVSILVTGIKKVHDKSALAVPAFNHSSATNLQNLPPGQSSPGIPSFPTVQYSRTSFNTAELFYSDSTNLPLPDLSTSKQRRLNQLVTMKWLNIEKPVIANVPAVRKKQTPETPVTSGCAAKLGAAAQDANGYYYVYNAHQYKPYGAMHPLATKQACVGIRRNGQICLWHQEDHGIEYKKVCSSLDLDDEDDEVLDASIAFSREGSVIVAVHTIASNSLKFYDVEIDWGFLVEAANHLTKMPGYRVPDNERIPPKLIVTKIFKYNLGDLSANNQRLVSIDLISPNFHQSTEVEVLLTFEKERRFSNDPVETTLVRYQLKELPYGETIHQAFKDIGGKRGVDTEVLNTKKNFDMKYMQKFTFNEALLCIEAMNLDMILCLTFCNGTIKILDRNSFEITGNPYKEKFTAEGESLLLPSAVTTLFDAGFEFPPMNFQPEYCCISPNICAYVALPFDESELYVRSAEARIDESFIKMKKTGLLLATAAAVALRHTSACYLGFFTDDLIATIRTELGHVSGTISDGYSYRLLVAILQESQRAISLNIDISTEQTDKMSQNQPLQRILTLQLSLGTGKNWKRNRSAKIALALVNMRFVASSVMYAIHTIYSNMQRFSRKGLSTTDTYINSKVREDSIIYIIGIIRWCLDYVVLLSKELLELQNAFKRNNRQEIEKLISTLFVVPVILGKVPRAFLLFSIANIRRLFSFVQKFAEKNYPSLTALITPENPMGAFKAIEKHLLLANTASIMDSTVEPGIASSAPVSSDGAANHARAIMAHPTVEAYYRIGAMIENCPIPLQSFEKFLLEADTPLRNLRLDPSTSLAVEQQIVCQGYVAKNFIEPLRKLCEIFDKSILSSPHVDVSSLYFYDTQWLRLDGYDDDDEIAEYFDLSGSREETEDEVSQLGDLASESVQVKNEFSGETVDSPKQKVRRSEFIGGGVLLDRTDYELSKVSARRLVYMNCYDGLVLDTLRKQLVKSSEFIQYDKMMVDGESPPGDVRAGPNNVGQVTAQPAKKIAMRFCIRCSAISSVHDEMLFVPGHPSLIENPVFQHYQRICFCGGSWANL